MPKSPGKNIHEDEKEEEEEDEKEVEEGEEDEEEEKEDFQTEIMLPRLSEVSSHIIIASRIKYGGGLSACKGLFLDYCRSTTIHGLRYIFSVHRPFYEKFYWLVLTLTSFYFAVSLMWDTYLKWQDSPVILGFDETLVPVHKIPFPTITICPEIKMDQNLFNFGNSSQRLLEELKQQNDVKHLKNFTQEELDYFAATLHICEEEVVRRFVPYIPSNVRPDIAQTLVDLSVSKNQTSPFCKWNGRFYFCHNLFNLIVSDEGVCYQFNGLESKDMYRNLSDLSYYDEFVADFQNDFDGHAPLNPITGSWSLESGYVDQGYNSYPQRTIFASVRNAFFSILQGFEHNLDYACRSFNQGYRIFLNSPESVPLTSGNYILLSHGDEVMISVLPQYMIGDQNLREFSPEKRQCFFNDERYLRYFRHYSQINCQTECLVNFTVAKCGCSKFWMPKPPEVPVCGVAEIDCYINAQKELNLLLQNQTLKKTIDRNFKIMCDCMPSCTSLEYNVELSKAAYDMAKTIEALREEHEFNDYLASRLSIYFKERQFTAIKRTVVFSTTTFFANCGGIFGLFMGISGLSFIEFLYFFSMRLIQNLRVRRSTKTKQIKRRYAPGIPIARELWNVSLRKYSTHANIWNKFQSTPCVRTQREIIKMLNISRNVKFSQQLNSKQLFTLTKKGLAIVVINLAIQLLLYLEIGFFTQLPQLMRNWNSRFIFAFF